MMNKTMDFSGVKGSNWYNESKFSGADLVTANASNRDLGVEDIRFYKPNGTRAKVVGTVRVYFVNGVDGTGTIYNSKDGKNLTFGLEQREYTDKDGNKKHADAIVSIPLNIQAQVLRHAESLMIEKAVAPKAPVGPTPEQKALAKAQADAIAEQRAMAELAKQAQQALSVEEVKEEALTAVEIKALLDGASTPEETAAIFEKYLS